MPVEIRELVIRAVVAPAGQSPAPPAASGSSQESDASREEIIAECVQQVLRVLQRAEER